MVRIIISMMLLMPAFSYGFDCDTTKNYNELALCRTQSLPAKEKELTVIYQKVKSLCGKGNLSEVIMRQQKYWPDTSSNSPYAHDRKIKMLAAYAAYCKSGKFIKSDGWLNLDCTKENRPYITVNNACIGIKADVDLYVRYRESGLRMQNSCRDDMHYVSPEFSDNYNQVVDDCRGHEYCINGIISSMDGIAEMCGRIPINKRSKFVLDKISEKYVFIIERHEYCESICEGTALLYILNRKSGKVIFRKYLDNVTNDLIIDDYNFDGAQDFAVGTGRQGSYGSSSFDIYLKSKSGSFSLNRNISDLFYSLSVSIDRKNKIISTSNKSGCCYHTDEDFKIKNNKPYIIMSDTLESGNDDYHHRTIRKRINGRLVIVSKKKIKP